MATVSLARKPVILRDPDWTSLAPEELAGLFENRCMLLSMVFYFILKASNITQQASVHEKEEEVQTFV